MACTSTTPKYIFQNGLRFVKPYYHTHLTTVKGRWQGRTLLDVFTTEFREFSESQYIEKIKHGEMSIVQRPNSPKSIELIGDALLSCELRLGDVIVHKKHKHERPVVGCDIKVLFEDDDLLVIDKPSGLPIHPVQNYYYNSVIEIMKFNMGVKDLYPCHRLDKLTSGVSLICKNQHSARKYQVEIQHKLVRKEYVARVSGKFPDGLVENNDDIVVVDTKKKFVDGVISKTALTKFMRMKYDDKSGDSIVRCLPITGRTHQIRIHLRNMGFPIVNDPLYNSKLDGLFANNVGDDLKTEKNFNVVEQKGIERRIDLLTGEVCSECETELYKDPVTQDMVLYLHAYKYYKPDEKGGMEWCYQSEMPDWSNF